MARRINQSKRNNQIYWEKWRVAGAVGPEVEIFELPGAERFSKYLRQRFGIGLTAEAQEVNGDSCRRYTIRNYGKALGVYTVFDQRPGEIEFDREFDGRIPGYVNPIYAMLRRKPFDRVCLVFANENHQIGSISISKNGKPGKKWLRHDRHDPIAFP